MDGTLLGTAVVEGHLVHVILPLGVHCGEFLLRLWSLSTVGSGGFSLLPLVPVDNSEGPKLPEAVLFSLLPLGVFQLPKTFLFFFAS